MGCGAPDPPYPFAAILSAPDLVTPVVGYRAWRVANGRLLSPYIPCRWKGPVLHAECFDANRSLVRGRGWLDAPHGSPHPDCQCGIYAYHRPGLRTYFGEVYWCEGLISGWGRVVVHGDGWRAEHARVEALAPPELDDPRRDAPPLAPVAERLGVPLVARDELAALAAALGGPVPASLRPG